MIQNWFVHAVIYVTLFLAAIPPILIAGPELEERLFPVVRIGASDIEQRGRLIRFYISGEKFRGCKLDRMTFAWNLNSLRIPAQIVDEGTGEIFVPRAIVPSGDVFRFGPLVAPIPIQADAYKDARLTATLYHHCHALYEIESDFSIPIER